MANLTKRILVEARETLSEESAWTRNEWAINEDGQKCTPGSQFAVAWCAVGACQLAEWNIFPDAGWRAEDARSRAIRKLTQVLKDWGEWRSVTEYNDSENVSHKQVLALFDEAIERCR